MLMIIKNITFKTLVTGDKSARIVLEIVVPNQIEELKELAPKMFVDVKFEVPDETNEQK